MYARRMEPYREQQQPAEVDRSILVVGLGGSVLGLDRFTGQVRWENGLPGGGYGEVFIALRFGALIVSATDDEVYRLDYHTGKTLWQQRTRSAGRATILIEHDHIVVGKGGELDAFDHHGRPLWQQKLEGRGVGRLALAFPGNVAQADDPGAE